MESRLRLDDLRENVWMECQREKRGRREAGEKNDKGGKNKVKQNDHVSVK